MKYLLILALALLIGVAGAVDINPGMINWTKWSIYDVRAYGAVGDGVTDDTTAIKNTMAAADAVHGIVYFPAGEYKKSYRLNLTSDITIIGDYGAVILDAPSAHGFYGQYITNVTIRGIRLRGDDSDGASLYSGILIADSTNITIEDCYVEDYPANGLYLTGDDTVLISGNTLTKNGLVSDDTGKTSGSGILLGYTGTNISKNVTISDNIITYNGNRSSSVAWCSHGIYVSSDIADPTGPKTANVAITGNILSGNSGAGVKANGAGVAITGNTMDYNGRSGIYMSCALNSTISGNTINRTTMTGDNGDGGISLDSYCRDVAVTGNSVSNAAYYGISFNGVRCLVAGNTVTGSGNYGVFMSGYNNTLSGNYISNAKLFGVYISAATSPTVKGNTIRDIRDSWSAGIFFTTTLYNPIVTDNRIFDAYYGVSSSSATGTGRTGLIADNQFDYTTTPIGSYVLNSGATLRQNRGTNPYDFGNKASDPTAYGKGDRYFNTGTNKLRSYNGTAWGDV